MKNGTMSPLKASERKRILPASEEPWKAFQVRHRSMELKRNAVLKTAAHLFVEHGYQKTSMSLLSTRLKITKPALYYYFRNKEEILVACYRSGIAAIESHLRPLDSGIGTALTRLQLFVQGYATVILTHEFGRCVAMIDDSELSAETRRGGARSEAEGGRLHSRAGDDGHGGWVNHRVQSEARILRHRGRHQLGGHVVQARRRVAAKGDSRGVHADSHRRSGCPASRGKAVNRGP